MIKDNSLLYRDHTWKKSCMKLMVMQALRKIEYQNSTSRSTIIIWYPQGYYFGASVTQEYFKVAVP